MRENNDSERLKLKELYDYSINMLKNTTERQYHYDIKSLYLLQATAVLAALFLGLVNNDTKETIQVVLIFIIYLSLFFTFIFLLKSLGGDKLMIFGGDKHRVKSTLLPNKIMENEMFIKNSIDEHYKQLINDYSDSIESIEELIEKKHSAYINGLVGFIIAVTTIILLGFKTI